MDWYIESINICFIFLHTWRISRCNLSYRICFIRFIHISILYHLNKQIIASEKILTVIIYLKRIIQLDNICIQRENKSILRFRIFLIFKLSSYKKLYKILKFEIRQKKKNNILNLSKNKVKNYWAKNSVYVIWQMKDCHIQSASFSS